MLSTFVLALLVAPGCSQEFKIPASLDKLSAKAKETVNVNLDSDMLGLAGKFMGKKGNEAETKKTLEGLNGIQVRTYQFKEAGAYDMKDVEDARTQLNGPGWKEIVNVKGEKETVSIHMKKGQGDQVCGMVIIAAEPKELTIVSLSGNIDMAQLGKLGGQFGVPNLGTIKPK